MSSKRVITRAIYRTPVRGRDVELGVFIYEPEVVDIAEYEYWSVSCNVESGDELVLAFNTVGVSTLQALSTTLWLLLQRLEQELGLIDFDWAAGNTEGSAGSKNPRAVNRAVPVGEAYVAASAGAWSEDAVTQFSIQIFAPSMIHEGVQIEVAMPGLAEDAQIEATNGIAALIDAFRAAHAQMVARFDNSWRFRLGDESPVDFDAFQGIYFGDEQSPLRSAEGRRGKSNS